MSIMASTESISKSSLIVLAVVVACFAVLWPKIFYPMVQSILFPYVDEEIQDSIKKLNVDDMLHSQIRESMGEARPSEKLIKDGNRGLFHPYLRHAVKPQSKGAGAVNLMIPMYTIAIILFFIYCLLKMTFNKRYDEACNSLVEKSQNLHSNSLCNYKSSECDDLLIPRKEGPPERKTQRALQQYGKDKVLIALKTIILEMEDIKGTFIELDAKSKVLSSRVS